MADALVGLAGIVGNVPVMARAFGATEEILRQLRERVASDGPTPRSEPER